MIVSVNETKLLGNTVVEKKLRLKHRSHFCRFCVSLRPTVPQMMSAEWSKYDINCNTVGPTIVLTDMGAKAWG